MDTYCHASNKFSPTCHRDGTVTYWSVYLQSWVRGARRIPDKELAAMNSVERKRVMSHLNITESDTGKGDNT